MMHAEDGVVSDSTGRGGVKSEKFEGFRTLIVVSVSLLLAACSSGGGGDSSVTPTATNVVAAPTATPTVPPASTPTFTPEMTVEGMLNQLLQQIPGATVLGNPSESSDVTVSSSGVVLAELMPGQIGRVSVPFNAPSGDVVGIGMRFGATGPIINIPTTNNVSGQTGGVLETEFTVPQEICDMLSSVCHDVKCYEFAVTASGTVSRETIQDVILACNGCSEPSCQDLAMCGPPPPPCNGLQEQGADTPETRVVDLGQTSGSFQFEYETFNVQDRLVVTYEGRVLFDTGCVGANGVETISYSGSSSLVTVSVTPNCDDGDSTQWNFTVSCPGGNPGPTPTPAPNTSNMTWTINDQCNDGLPLDVRFFDTTNNLVWPPDTTQVYITENEGGTVRQTLSCNTGASICFGAQPRTTNPTRFWGAGINGDRACTECCADCADVTITPQNLICN